MTVIALGAAKPSPGVTTAVLALAARWPSEREAVVVEADPNGSDLVPWLSFKQRDSSGLRDTPSTVQLAASSRSGVSDRALLEHLQRLPGPAEVRVLVGPPSPFAASAAMTSLVACGFAAALDRFAGADILLDVGRLDAASAALTLIDAFGSVVLVCRPNLSSVLHTRDLAGSLRNLGIRPSLLVIGERPYSPDEVAEATGVELVGVLPDDPVGAQALRGEVRNAKVLDRSRLLRAAVDVAHQLAPAPATPPAPPLSLSATIRHPDHYWAPRGDAHGSPRTDETDDPSVRRYDGSRSNGTAP